MYVFVPFISHATLASTPRLGEISVLLRLFRAAISCGHVNRLQGTALMLSFSNVAAHRVGGFEIVRPHWIGNIVSASFCLSIAHNYGQRE